MSSNESSETEPSRAELVADVERLNAENGKLKRFLHSMQELSESLEAATNEAHLHELLGQILDHACEAVEARDASLLVLDEDNDELVFVLSRGKVPPEQLAWRRIPAGEGIAGWVVTQREATVVNNAQADERFYSQLDMELQFRTESILAAPIIGDSNVLGVIEIVNKIDGELFNVHDQLMLSLLCRYAGELLFALGRRAHGEVTKPRTAHSDAAVQLAG